MPDPNPYDALLQQDTAQRVRVNMMGAVDAQPDTEAKLQALARRYAMPVDAVRLRQPEIEKQARLDALDYDTLAREYPRTAARLADPQQAAIAHDDVDNMSAIERAVGTVVGYVMGSRENSLWGDVGAGGYRASRGMSGATRAA
ncbi:MAG: hypothetical protein MK041_03370, partial [Aquabacterium sp.]|nr:hypothetical protein [Aquabacterium sp.]